MSRRAASPTLLRARWAVAVSVLAVAALGAALPGVTWAAQAVPGSAGTDTSLPLTPSQLQVSGRGPFEKLRITVNQTKNLANQAISLTWSGGTPTTKTPKAFSEHFLQMFQCWGDDDGSIPGNPGPPPEQCQQGAVDGVFGGRIGLNELFNPNALSRRSEARAGFKPFRAVNGTVVAEPIDRTYTGQPGAGGGEKYWINEFYNVITTNEIAGARTEPDGTGSELFEATTGLESPGLGCGQKVQKQPDGSTTVPRCWLVVVPRGSAVYENGTDYDPTFPLVGTSPLAPLPWKNRIAIPLDFNSLDSSCALTADQRRIVGNEMLSAAVSSWQPKLCATPGLSPYAYNSVGDSGARQQLLSGAPGAPGMAVVGRPIDPATVDPQNPVVYAPLTLSGTAIGFNIERFLRILDPQPQGLEELRGVRVAQLNLTPRLVAKLLTQSYRSQVEIAQTAPPYPWSGQNPVSAYADPDFLQFNPEFELLNAVFPKNAGGLVLPGASSDAAQQVWEWVFSDPEARAWLAGAPDAWGMKVNPFYSTSPSADGTSFGEPLPDSYPKSDPHCYQGPDLRVAGFVTTPPQLCGLDWFPYARGLRDSARATRAASDGARTLVNQNAVASDQVYKPDEPQPLGTRSILSITDTPSAALYGLQTARLSRAGDNAADRRFIAPDQDGLAAGGQALAAKAVPGFLEPSPATAPPGAYPLTTLSYAAVAPLSLDATARKEYAAFVDYAAGPGQAPGYETGQLPPGYQPLSDQLRAQASSAATKIRDLTAAPVDEPPAEPGTAADTSAPGTEPPPEAGADGQPTEDPTSPAVPVLPGTTDPTKKGALEKIVDALATPFHRLAATRYALPVLVVVALLAALGALEITKRRRRGVAPDGTQPSPTPEPGPA